MTICNACRYCEGLCAVFPAMERRSVFEDADLRYLANVCHDCRACVYACQYAPPHEFGVNIPRAFAELRRETYARHARPRTLGAAYRRNGLWVALTVATLAVLVPLVGLVLTGPGVLTRAHVGPGAFYEVVPMAVMVGPASVISLLAVLALLASGVGFWHEIRGGENVTFRDFSKAAADAFRLVYLGGGSDECNYPDERFSQGRRRFHHFVFWGFALDFLATTVAAFFEHVLHQVAPYPLMSLPVILGTVGGVFLLIGTTGLLVLKGRSDRMVTDPPTKEMDVAFLWLLWATSSSGLLLLALRESTMMPALLLLHLGVVAGFFVTLPFGKFVHAIHRYLALVKYSAEGAHRAA